MSAFFNKVFTLFLSKIEKNAIFTFCSEISIAEVRLRFNLVENIVSQLQKCVALQKLICAFCAAFLLVEKVVARCCAALLR